MRYRSAMAGWGAIDWLTALVTIGIIVLILVLSQR